MSNPFTPPRGWDVLVRDSGLVEAVCPHGVGHPIPAQYQSENRRAGVWMTHGCDGCCRELHQDKPKEAAMSKRKQLGVVRAWAYYNIHGTPDVGCLSIDKCFDDDEPVLLVDPRKYDVVPKRPRPAKKKAGRKWCKESSLLAWGEHLLSKKPPKSTKKKRSRK